jgi:hypothetical protein
VSRGEVPKEVIGILESSGFQRVRIKRPCESRNSREILAVDLGKTRVRNLERSQGSALRELRE